MPILDRAGVRRDRPSARAGPVAGVPIAWESHCDGAPAVLLLPAWSIVHSRMWKLQVPYLARYHRVITFDGRGNGRSGRPPHGRDYNAGEYVGDAVAVLDAAGIASAVVVGLSLGAMYGVLLAGAHPERVLGLVTLAATIPLTPLPDGGYDFDAELERYEGWAKFNRHYWQRDYRGFLDFFFSEMFSEPHSTRQIEDGVEWGLDTDADTLTASAYARSLADQRAAEEACRAVRCPVLAVHGDEDHITPHARSVRLAELTGAPLVTIEGGGHGLQARHPVEVNALLHDFAARFGAPPAPPARWRRALARPRRALYVSSPIGLGHARRDLAIADELCRRVPDLEIDWLAQEPTRTALEAAGERVHPMSRHLLSEAEHIDAWAGDHELWVFECIRRMDEILLANYMVFRDLTRAEPYDLWIGDEAWDLDYHLHENPEDKRAPFVWLTDFVGWLPLPEHGEREAELTADLNAEMVEHVERFPSLRDLSLFVGDADDVVEDVFGPGLPSIRTWTEERFIFTGQVAPSSAAPPADGDAPLCVASAGGSAAGATLLDAGVRALPLLREEVPDARMLVVAGPRLDPRSLGTAEGLEVAAYVPDLDRRLAGCDVALTHGGLTTGMELIGARRPFVSVPLRRHFEQLRHVRHRLERHGHRRTLAADEATPERLAAELAAALAEPPAYRPVTGDGAGRAAELIARLL
jgi:pimeloyl-ACP methyl ester carboxylesterase/predicted glycosyltransferase